MGTCRWRRAEGNRKEGGMPKSGTTGAIAAAVMAVLAFSGASVAREGLGSRLDMERFKQQQMKALNGVYWLDQGHGIVHLPIADAMRKLAEEGIPDWPTPKPAAKR